MSEIRSKGQILRATGIIGGSSLVNIAAGAIRVKIVAVALGASGVGQIGVLVNLVNTAAAASAWGISNSGARALAGAASEDETNVAWRALSIASVALGGLGAALIFLFRLDLAQWLFGTPENSALIGWTAVAVGLSVIALAQNGLLTGLKRVGDLALLSATSALLTMFIAAPLVLILRERAIVPYVLLGPVVTAAVGTFLIGRLRRPGRASRRAVVKQWRQMASLGAALTAASVAILCGQLAMRVAVQRSLGLEGVGYFQANLALSVNYIGLALGALSTDYFPRLVPHVGKPSALRDLINGQAFVSLLLAAPLIVLAIGFAPLVMALLYAPSFAPAAHMLPWQMLGDLMRIAAWPLSFVLLASGRGPTFASNEAAAAAAGVVMTFLLVPRFGIAGAGMAYLAMNLFYLLALSLLVSRHAGWPWEARTVRCWLAAIACAIAAMLLARWKYVGGMAGSLAAAAWLGIAAWKHLHDALPPRLRKLFGLDRGNKRNADG